MKKLTVICMALIALAFMASCRGPMGPEGPVGPAGPSGNDGNANVKSATITITTDQWYWDETSWRVDINYQAIDADINDFGAVLVYMNEGVTWRQLPLTFYYYDGDTDEYYSSSLEVSSYQGGVSIFWTESDMWDGYQPDTHDFKIVVIAASCYNSRSDIDYSNYEAVKAAFQLAD